MEGTRRRFEGRAVRRISLQDLPCPADEGVTFMVRYWLPGTRDMRIGFVGRMSCSDQEVQRRVRSTN